MAVVRAGRIAGGPVIDCAGKGWGMPAGSWWRFLAVAARFFVQKSSGVGGKSSERQPHDSVLPLRRFRCQPNEEQFVDCRANVEALRKQEDTSAIFSGILERLEVGRHGAYIVGDK